jgi:hypothetical protein
MKCTSRVVVAALVVSSAAAFTTPAFRGSTPYAATTTAVYGSPVESNEPTPANLGSLMAVPAQQLSSALAMAALTMMVALPPAAVDAAVAPAETIVLTTTKGATTSKAKPAAVAVVSTISPAQKSLNMAQESVTSTTARLNAVTAEISAKKAAASKDKALLNTALQEADRATKAYARETEFMSKMPAKSPVITLKAQKDKVGT